MRRAGSAVSRREFLRTGAMGGGGLWVAVTLGGCGNGDRPAERARQAAARDAGPGVDIRQNAWLSISTTGAITFYSPFAEMGQGVYTSIPTLLAEELEVPVAWIDVVDGGAQPQFVNDLLGIQVTGGSTAVRDSWIKLRRAGAEARMRLALAAADRWGVGVDEVTARGGRIVRNVPGETIDSAPSLSYGELADAAAGIGLPEDQPVVLKPSAEFRKIGKPQRRLDTTPKTDGTAQFGIDVRRPGQLYGAIVMCPVLGGRVAGLNELRAREMPGVVDVVLIGDGVVVVAEHFWQALQGRDVLDVQWSTDDHDQLDNEMIRDGLQQAAADMTGAASARADGDVDAALDAAAQRIDATYELPLLAHATMEPMNCTAEFVDGVLHVWVGTQVPGTVQAVAAIAAGIAREQVVIHTTFLGGGFGRRLEVDFIPAAVSAAQKIGRPVQLIWTREDDMTHDLYRPPACDKAAAAFDADGRLTAWRLDLVGPSITARWAPAVVADTLDPFAIEGAANFPYAVPNVSVRYKRHEIGIDVGYWRSVSHALNCFVAESFIDELAHARRADPYEFRRALLADQPLWRNVLDLAARSADWGKPQAGGYHGIALMGGYDTYMALVAEIGMLRGKLRVRRVTCAVDCGQVINPDGVRAQVESGVIFGLSAALWGEVNIAGGEVQERNFDSMRILRINEVPDIDVHIVASDRDPGGMGEPATALVAPAVCNAYFKARFERLRSLPLSRHGLA